MVVKPTRDLSGKSSASVMRHKADHLIFLVPLYNTTLTICILTNHLEPCQTPHHSSTSPSPSGPLLSIYPKSATILLNSDPFINISTLILLYCYYFCIASAPGVLVP